MSGVLLDHCDFLSIWWWVVVTLSQVSWLNFNLWYSFVLKISIIILSKAKVETQFVCNYRLSQLHVMSFSFPFFAVVVLCCFDFWLVFFTICNINHLIFIQDSCKLTTTSTKDQCSMVWIKGSTATVQFQPIEWKPQ